jgi:hypothetical protein
LRLRRGRDSIGERTPERLGLLPVEALKEHSDPQEAASL